MAISNFFPFFFFFFSSYKFLLNTRNTFKVQKKKKLGEKKVQIILQTSGKSVKRTWHFCLRGVEVRTEMSGVRWYSAAWLVLICRTPSENIASRDGPRWTSPVAQIKLELQALAVLISTPYLLKSHCHPHLSDLRII